MKWNKDLKKALEQKKFLRITRKVSKKNKQISRGYLIDFSDEFVVLQDSDDFRLSEYTIFKKTGLSHIRYNAHDVYYDKIMEWEGKKKQIGLKLKLNLNSWKSIFESLSMLQKPIIVECEHPQIDEFIIGPIKRITNKKIFIQYFDAEGILDKKLTKIKFKHITKVTFGDRYTEIFSKYLRNN